MARSAFCAFVALVQVCGARAAAAEQSAGGRPATAARVQYDFVARDTSGSGPDVRAFQDEQSFRGRLAHLVGEAEADAQVASKFAGVASQILGAPQTSAGSPPTSFDGPGLRPATVAAAIPARPGRGGVADVEAETARMNALRKEISELVPRLEAGGRKARDALVRLVHEVSEPNAKTTMKAMGVLASASPRHSSTSASCQSSSATA